MEGQLRYQPTSGSYIPLVEQEPQQRTPGDKMLVFRQLLLLLWKGATLRKRHFIVTIFEFLIPLFLLSLAVYLQSMTGSSAKENVKPPKTYFENNVFNLYSSGFLLYTPHDDKTELLTNMTLDIINKRGSGSYNSITATGCGTEEELYHKATELVQDFKSVYGIVYETVDEAKALRYKLRMPEDFYTESKFPGFGGEAYSYGYSDFVGIQAAVDGAFINMSSPTNDSVYLQIDKKTQKMPYPAHYDVNTFFSSVSLIPMFINQGFIFMIVVFVKRLVDEKANRAKEMMRMMGMNDLVYFFGNWLVQLLMMMLVLTVAVILFKIPFGKTAVIDQSDGFLIWIIFLLFTANSLLFCMAISTFFNRPVISAIATLVIWVLAYFLPVFLLDPPGQQVTYWSLKLGQKLGACLLPNSAMYFAFKVIAFHEITGDGIKWSNMNHPASDDDLTVSMVMGMMVASSAIFSFIIWYVDNVWPWQFGIPKHPLYFLMPSYWRPRKSKLKESLMDDVDEPEEYDTGVDPSYFEGEPQDKGVGIAVHGLSKAFGWGSSRKVAVKNVSLNIYHGEITALLGHNGAGKTTTMNVITGLFPPSTGTALINGYSVLDQLKEARRSLGLCPQHNVLYESLTVEEHLILFAGLKGRTFQEMKPEIESCLNLLQLQHKKHDLAKTLSGGMKRKLSLGIAMIGESKVLILDEPTSGMDPQARRVIWDLLQQIKFNRTIVLTTHYMEEADILGDRIAIMAEGVVQCCGSPHFLKKTFGAGYHLRVSKGETFKEQKLQEVVKSYVPSAYVESEMRTEVGYVLPVTDAEPFVNMFTALESSKGEIGYTACGLTITTMEDVFIKVGQLAEKAQDTRSEQNGTSQLRAAAGDRPGFAVSHEDRLIGFDLWIQQVKGLLLKRFHDSKRYTAFLIFMIILPLAITFVMLYVRNSILQSGRDNIKQLPLNLKSIFGKTKGHYVNSLGSDVGDALANQLKRVYQEAGAEPIRTDDLPATVFQLDENSIKEYRNKYIVGGIITNQTEDYWDQKYLFKVVSVYSPAVYHSIALSQNLMDVALLRTVTGNDAANIETTNAPLPRRSNLQQSDQGLNIAVRLIFAAFMPLAMSFLSSSFVLFPIHERQTKSKLIQLMTGVGGLTFWVTHFLWDFAMHFLASCFMLIPFAAMDAFGALNVASGGLGIMFTMLLLYGWSAIPLSYLMSFISKKPSTGFVAVTAINFFSGMFTTLGITIYKLVIFGNREVTDHSETIAWFIRIMPNFALTWGTVNLDALTRGYVTCGELAKQNISTAGLSQMGLLSLNCNKGAGSFEAEACGRDMLFMFLSGLIFFGILTALELNLVRIWYKASDTSKQQIQPQMGFQQNMGFQPNVVFQPNMGNQPNVGLQPNVGFQPNTAINMMPMMPVNAEDPDVAAERKRVDDLFLQGQMSQDALVVHNLTKHFGTINAVDHVTFGVHHEECFGLLGVNGAGKTTTFSMLTGDLTIGEGNAIIGQYSVKDHLKKFQHHIGYCPQFDALLDRLTGREALNLFARLRGIPEAVIPRVVNSLIDVVDLQKHADKTADKYSGGNRRKLSLALSLVGSPPVVFLDEPTAGVDPASRRKIWNAFVQAQQTGGTSFILTTHSMEECEALCGRLVIMVNGQFRCCGSIQYLKSIFGQGYTIVVKLNKEQYLDPGATQAVQQFFHQTFPGCQLKDAHEGMLHYHVLDTRFTWSHLFREMEQAKQHFKLEDYLISDTTLEQIFLAFARTQRLVATS